MPQPYENDPDVVGILRRINWAIFINYWVCFPFLLSHGVLSHCAFPAVSLVPMSVSFCTACYCLAKLRSKDGQYQIVLGEENETPKRNGEIVLSLLDLGLIVGDLLGFAFTCVFTYAKSYGGRFQALAAYATIMLFVDAGLHAILFKKNLPKVFTKGDHDCAQHCSNCHPTRDMVETPEERYTDEAAAPREGGGRS